MSASRFILLSLLMLGGCVERMELRGQQCAHVCIDRHGAKPSAGVYYSWVEHGGCYCRLWNQQMTYEGHLSDKWRPE